MSSKQQAAISLLYGFVVNVISTLRPYAPQLVPILVFAFFVPLAVLLSAFAGYIVWTNLSVSWESSLYFQYGYAFYYIFCRCPDCFWSDGVPPYAQLILPSLVPTQRYDVSVNLLLPASQSNLALGNFMTTLTLSTLANKTVASVRRPVVDLTILSRSLLTTLNRQSPSPHVRPSFSQIQTLFVSRYPCYHHLLPVPLLWRQLLK